MKNNTYKSIVILSLFSLICSSCNDYLGTVPDNRTEINTPEKISNLLVSAYPKGNYASFCELMSDNTSENFEGSSPSPIYSDPYFWEDVSEDDQDSPIFYWASCYSAIASSNLALESIDKLGNTPNLNPQKGEALITRAYSHFMLVNLFSKFYEASTAGSDPGIPYVTEVENVVIKQYERRTVAYVYEMIEKDLLEALPLINDQAYKIPSYHFNRNAAYAFASRFYLHKRDYDKVIEYANRVAVEGSFVSLMRNWNTDYSTKSFNIIAASYGQSTEKTNLLIAETNSFWGRFWAGQKYGLSSELGQQLYFSAHPAGATQTLSYSLFGSDRGVYLPKYDELFVRVSPNANTGQGYVMMPLFTSEEVLFNRAEAYLNKGNTTAALNDLNAFLSLRIDNYSATTNILTIEKL
ncbi:MAG: RagB/SusD family nutrient uptake outer membrane protein, partial [Leadbetterella sp.]